MWWWTEFGGCSDELQLYECNRCSYNQCKLQAIQQNSLNVIKGGTGSGVVSSSPAGINCGLDCTEVYTGGTVVTLTASPDTSSSFSGWSGACSGTGTCVVTMDAAKSVTATFTLRSYTITATAGSNGSITPSGGVVVNHGASQSFTISPSANYTLGSVVVDGSSVGAVTSYSFTNVIGAHTISASFNAIQQNSLNVIKGGTGSGVVSSEPGGDQLRCRLHRGLYRGNRGNSYGFTGHQL